jgi:hypothetical protein
MKHKLKYLIEQWAFSTIKIQILSGKTSNIKVCCILFFILIWTFLIIFNLNGKYMKLYNYMYNYIPCPSCIIFGNPNRCNNIPVKG